LRGSDEFLMGFWWDNVMGRCHGIWRILEDLPRKMIVFFGGISWDSRRKMMMIDYWEPTMEFLWGDILKFLKGTITNNSAWKWVYPTCHSMKYCLVQEKRVPISGWR
jgi:hypothetical protein